MVKSALVYGASLVLALLHSSEGMKVQHFGSARHTSASSLRNQVVQALNKAETPEARYATLKNYPTRPTETEGCSCSAQCRLEGDPHCKNIYGQQWIVEDLNFKILEAFGITISAETFGMYFMGKINFGSEQIHNSSCVDNGIGHLTTKTHSTKNGDEIVLEVECAKPKKPAKFGNDYHLDATVTIKKGTGSLIALDASGVCAELREADDLPQGDGDTDMVDFGDAVSGETCSCVGMCSIKGDPHVEDMVHNQFTEKDSKFDIYDWNGFKFEGVGSKDGFWYMDSIKGTKNGNAIAATIYTPGGAVSGKCDFHVSQCADYRFGRKTELPLGSCVADGKNGKVDLIVDCAREHEGSREGTFFLNAYLSKTDVGSTAQGAGADFVQIESTQQSSGVCVDKLNERFA
jgi:hypothetical protein